MGVPSLPVDEWNWLAGFHSRPLVLSSPHPTTECLQRLATVTTQRGANSWYFDHRSARSPEPRLRGNVGPSWISVARFEEAARRNSFAPWLDARAEPATGGGTTFTGRIGLQPAVRLLISVMAGIWGLIALAGVTGGVVLMIRGHLSGLAALLIPLGVIAAFAAFNTVGLRSLERGTPKLVEELNGILDSTATFTGPASVAPPSWW
jgi:hypothetical protein